MRNAREYARDTSTEQLVTALTPGWVEFLSKDELLAVEAELAERTHTCRGCDAEFLTEDFDGYCDECQDPDAVIVNLPL